MEFEKYRENGIINLDKAQKEAQIVICEKEQNGKRPNKYWLNSHAYLYKDIYPGTYEDYAELIGYEFAKLIGIKYAEYDLAIYNGNRGVITKNIVDDNTETLISGTEIVSKVYTEYIYPIIGAKIT